MSKTIELYINTVGQTSPEQRDELEQFLKESQGHYHFSHCYHGLSHVWSITFVDIDTSFIKMFMESFYAKQYITNGLSRSFRMFVIGESRTAQILLQMNTSMMVDYMNSNNETDTIIMNEQMTEMSKKLNGMDEFNNQNGLYTFKYVVETLLDSLAEQGLLKNNERIKKLIFKTKTLH